MRRWRRPPEFLASLCANQRLNGLRSFGRHERRRVHMLWHVRVASRVGRAAAAAGRMLTGSKLWARRSVWGMCGSRGGSSAWHGHRSIGFHRLYRACNNKRSSCFFFKNALLCPDSFRTPFFFLWSQYKHLLSQSAVSTITGSWGFSYAAPSIWKKTPSRNLEISNSLSFASFKKKNKTYYFSCTFS